MTGLKTIPRLLKVDPQDPLNKGLVGWWPLQDKGGIVARDISGYNNHGTLTSMDPATDWVTGQNGYALDFDGSNDHIDCGSAASLDLTDFLSFSIWMRTASYVQGNCLFGKDDPLSYGVGYRAYGWTDGKMYFEVKAATQYGVSYSLNQWNHFLFTYDNVTAKTYLNGKEAGNQSVSNGLASSGQPLYLAYGRNVPVTLPGQLSNARLWSVVLTPADALRLYQEPWAGIQIPRATSMVVVPAAITYRRRVLVGG